MESVKKNFIYNVIYQILVIILPLVTSPYISRVLGAELVGIYSYTYSVVYYFLIFAMLGISNHGNRMIAASRNDKEKMSTTFWSIYGFQVFTFLIAIVSYIIYVIFGVNDNKLIYSIQLIYILSGLFDISWLFFGLEKFKITVTRNILIKVFTVISIFVFVRTQNDLWKYTLIMVLGTLFSQLYLWFYLKKEVYFKKIDFKLVVKNIKPILILFVPVLSFSIYKVMDKIMLGNMVGYEQVGYFNNAEKIINIPMGIITALGTVMLPRMSNLIANGDKEKTEKYINMSIKLVTILASAIAFGLMGISDIFTPIFFGIGFMECSKLIVLLAVTIFFISWANVVRTQYLIPHHYDKIYIFSTILGAILNLIINLILIPKIGGIGAAIGTIVAEFTLMFIQSFAVRHENSVFKQISGYLPVILIGFIMMVIVRIIGAIMDISIWTLVLQILVGIIVYCSLLLLFLFLKKDEFYILIVNMFKLLKKKYIVD